MIDNKRRITAVGDRNFVSFDVFDTLLLRPYVKPTDLFRHLELLFEKKGFCDYRIAAERSARRKKHEEITLDEIYSEMSDDFSFLKNKETEIELEISIANRTMLELYRELLQEKKKIILISDMYLPSNIIEQMLKKNGFDGFYKLYVSSEYGVTKHNGKMFDLIVKDLNIEKDDIIHIGDNKYSDYKVPMSKGIDAILCEKPICEYFKKYKDEYRFYKKNKTLERSIIVSLDMINESFDNKWFELGQRFGGPLATSYSIIINEGSDDHLHLYASRDGYNLKRISEELFPANETQYIYAQRLLLDVFTEENLPYGKMKLPDKATNKFQYRKKSVAMMRILNFFKKELDISVSNDPIIIEKIYNERIEEIDDLRKKGMKQYSDYLKTICQNKSVDLIDCTTMKYSSQKLVEMALNRGVKGHYLVTLSENDDYDHTTMCDWHSPVIGWMNIDIPEFFLCSPEYPLSSWNNRPIFDTSSEEEKYRISIYNDVSDGELEYAKRYRSIFGEYMIPFDYWSVVKWSKLAAVRGTVYHDLLKNIKWASDPDHSEYMPLITGVGSVKNIIKKLFISVITKINKD